MPDTWNDPRVWVAGERVGASKMNEISTLLRVLYPYTTAGDVAVRDAGGNYLSRLPKAQISGLLHKSGSVDFSPGQTFSSTWADITGASLSLVLSYTCTIFVFAAITGYQGSSGRIFIVRANVDGNTDANDSMSSNGGEASEDRNEALPYIFRITGVAAGTKTVKLQCQANSDPNIVTRGRLIAQAFVE